MISRLILTLSLLLFLHCCYSQQLHQDPLSGISYLMKQGGSAAIILIHGYRSNEADLFGLKDHFHKDYTIISPRGPIDYQSGSNSWYNVDFSTKPPGRDLVQANSSIAILKIFIRQMIKSHHLDSTNTLVGGFSQGAILSYTLAIEHPELVGGYFGIGGALLKPDMKALNTKTESYKDLEVFIGHGIEDPLLTIDNGRKVNSVLTDAGIQTTYREYNMKHEISRECLADLIRWCDEKLLSNDNK